LREEMVNKIETHNSHTSTQMAFVRQMAEAITSFESRLNGELQQVTISNLTGIKVKIETSTRFADLQKDLATYARTTESSLMNSAFYERLETFCAEYLIAKNGTGKLDVSKIITGIKYVFEVNGRLETKAQSHGTTGMLNAVLLSILMQRLIPDDVQMNVPIVFDEVGSLQKANLMSLIEAVESRNFSLFVANPENTGVISSVLKNWHDLTWYRLLDSAPVGDAIDIYTQQVERLILERDKTGEATHAG